MKMLIPVSREIGMGKILHSSLMAHSHIPHSRLSSRSEKWFPHSWLRHSWGNNCFTTPAEPFMENKEMCHSWFMRNFIFSNSWIHHSYGKITSLILSRKGSTHFSITLLLKKIYLYKLWYGQKNKLGWYLGVVHKLCYAVEVGGWCAKV